MLSAKIVLARKFEAVHKNTVNPSKTRPTTQRHLLHLLEDINELIELPGRSLSAASKSEGVAAGGTGEERDDIPEGRYGGYALSMVYAATLSLLRSRESSTSMPGRSKLSGKESRSRKEEGSDHHGI